MAEHVGGIVWTASIETQQLVNGERQINQSTNRAGRNFDNMERKATGLNTRLTQLAKTLAGVFAVRQLQRFAMETIRAVDEQNTFAQSISVSYQELQKLQFAAEQNGATINELNNSLRRLTRRTEEAARGTGAAVQAFENLGLNARELEKLSPDEIFLRVADAFQQLEGSGKEVSTAFGLFDTEGAKLINTLRRGSAGIKELGDEAERSGRIISQQTAEDAAKFNEELNKLQGAAKGAAVSLGAELVPAITDLMTATTNWLSTGDNAAKLINGIGIAAQATAVVLAGRLVGAMALSLQTTVQDTVATIANEKAKLAKAQAANTAAAAEVALLKSVQAGLVAQLQSTKNEAMKAQIRARLAANTAALIKANTALTASQVRLNGVINAGTVATRGFAAGLALLGGPVGVVVMAASAFALMAMRTKESTEEYKDNRTQVDLLSQSYDKMTRAQLQNAQLNLRSRLDELEQEQNLLQITAMNMGATTEEGIRAQAEYDTLTQRMQDYAAALKEVEDRLKSGQDGQSAANDGADKGSDSFSSLRQSLHDMQMQLQMNADEWEEYSAMQNLGSEATAEQRKEIAALVAGIQALRKNREDLSKAEQAAEDRASTIARMEEELHLQEIKNQLGNDEYEIRAAIAALGADATDDEIAHVTNMIEQMQALRFEADLVGQSIQEAFKETGLRALDDFSDGLARAAVEGSSVREMIHGIGKTILTDLLSSVIRYWAGQAAAAIFGQKAAAGAAIVGAGAATAAWTAPATLASIATLGGAAGIGVAAVQGALATSQGLTALSGGGAGGAMFGGARQYGGPVESGKAYRVNETEPEMFMAGGHQYLMPNMRGEVMNSKQVGGGDVNVSIRVNNNAPGVDVGVRQQGSGNNRQFILDVVKADITGYGQSTVGALTTVTNIKRKTQ